MNRTITMMGILAMLVAGCGSNSNNTGGNGGTGGTGGSGTDMSAASSGDASMTLPPDMQPAYGCHALAACASTCTDAASCSLCNMSATPQARMLYQAATRCVRRECYPHPDGGPAPCTQGGGTPSAECTLCQGDSIKMAGSCGADTMYCGTCYTAYAACEADLP